MECPLTGGIIICSGFDPFYTYLVTITALRYNSSVKNRTKKGYIDL